MVANYSFDNGAMVASVSWFEQVKDALLVNAQQQLQQCGRTIQDLTAQLQTATTNAACKLQVSYTYSC